MGMFGAQSVFGHRIKGMIWLWPEQVWTCNVTRHHLPLLSPSVIHDASGSCNKLGTPWCMLAGYCYATRHGMKVQNVTPFRVSHLQCYGVTARGNVTSEGYGGS
jgi:hypothetical protein